MSRPWHQARPGPWQGSLSFAKSGSRPGSRTRSKLKSRGERTLLSSSSQAAPVAAPEQSPEVAKTLPRNKTTVHRSEQWGHSLSTSGPQRQTPHLTPTARAGGEDRGPNTLRPPLLRIPFHPFPTSLPQGFTLSSLLTLAHLKVRYT